MAHYALLDENNFVKLVIVGIDENEFIENKTPEEWYGNFHKSKCVRTSYNGKIRKRFAGIGFYYDEENDVFIDPQPFPSWILDNDFDWQPPVPKPISEDEWIWNEENKNWINGEAL